VDQLDKAVPSSSASLIKKKTYDDGDKRTPLKQPKYVTELDELVAEIRSATGMIEDQGLIRGIIENLESRGGTLREFLDWIKPRARGDSKTGWVPASIYLKLANGAAAEISPLRSPV
jgi:hypothetical protein